ncbi:MAG: hypothetical protein OZ921_09815 [Sorangiineae bacterium]|nr:hypothetical protein [Polyangiaceae bacterium]MEB2322800.1 hypothetical protein [Sorangiineae bacterium]
MAYRQPDEDALREREREDAVRRELTDRASAGRARRAAEERRARAEAEAALVARDRAFDEQRLRWRVSRYAEPGVGWAPPPRELVAWVVLSGFAAALLSIVSGWRWPGFAGALFALLLPGFALALPAHALVYWALGRRDARRVRAWVAGRPFPVEGFVELLGRPGVLTSVTLEVAMRMGGAPPSDALVLELLGQVDAGGEPSTVAASEGALRIHLPRPRDVDQAVYVWLAGVVRDVLEPLHRAAPMAKVVVSGTYEVIFDGE